MIYLGEANGGRILRATTGTTQVTASGTEQPPLDVETWDALPGGESGDCLFRSTDWTLTATNGYTVEITPTIDGVAWPVQTFSRTGAGTWTEQAFLSERGTRMRARCRVTVYGGTVRLEQATWTAAVLRTTP